MIIVYQAGKCNRNFTEIINKCDILVTIHSRIAEKTICDCGYVFEIQEQIPRAGQRKESSEQIKGGSVR